MPPEPTNPIEPEVTQESTVEPVSSPPANGELGEGTQVQDSLRPSKSNEWTVPVREMPEAEGVIVATPVSEPVFSPPAKEEMPKAEEVEPIIPEPISEPTQTTITPPDPLTLPPSAPSLRREGEIPPAPKLDSFHINMARARELLVKARYVIQLNKRKKMDKIMGLFDKHAPTHIRNRIGVGEVKITNREVRDLLRLSHDMVNIYMNVLIKEGKIKREGKSTATHYTKL